MTWLIYGSKRHSKRRQNVQLPPPRSRVPSKDSLRKQSPLCASSCDNRQAILELEFSKTGYFPAMKIKVTKFSYELKLVLKVNSPENWYGWTRECCLSLHDSGPSQLACPDTSLTTSIFSQQKPEGMSPLVTRSQNRNKMKGELESLCFLHKMAFFCFSLLLMEHLLFIYT